MPNHQPSNSSFFVNRAHLFLPPGISKIVLLGISVCLNCSLFAQVNFIAAEPIWPQGRELDKNLTCGFWAPFQFSSSKPLVLKIAASSIYRAFLNGQFIAHGPARAGHGYYRMDEIPLNAWLKPGKNILAIEVAGYNVNSYYLLDQPAFLQAEVISGQQVLAATRATHNDFQTLELSYRVQKVPRYSFQRPFIEYYIQQPKTTAWRTSPTLVSNLVCIKTAPKALIPRGVGYPAYALIYPSERLSAGKVIQQIKRNSYWKDRSLTDIGPKLGGFSEDQLALNPAIALQEMDFSPQRHPAQKFQGEKTPLSLTPLSYQIVDFGKNLTGFMGTKLQVVKGGRLLITFDEILTRGDVDFKRSGTINALTYDLAPGYYELESFEPYTARYLKYITTTADIKIKSIYLRELANAETQQALFTSSDNQLNRIFTAGIQTFRQNTTDLFMDCPSRERAGWLCDSYFTARVAQDVNGHAQVERNFFENYALPDSFAHLPAGMLPMCYPADHYDGVFIPNWSLWFILQLQEYGQRSRDRVLIQRLKPKVVDLLQYFEKFKNEDGLLENLESWVFIEWSAANDYVQDVNYPTNMLYAAALHAAGQLYGVEGWLYEAEDIRQTIRKQAFNGQFFVDNAVRSTRTRRLELTTHMTEVCQYFAFYFEVVTPYSHPTLWENLVQHFGPGRLQTKYFPEVHMANAFVGNYLRLELLSRYKQHAKLLQESIAYFDYMARETGTLWENISSTASCNHGFASHIVHVIYRDILGLKRIDPISKKVVIQFNDIPLNTCQGQLPYGRDIIKISWQKIDEQLLHHIQIPQGYTLEIENNSKLPLSTKLDFH